LLGLAYLTSGCSKLQEEGLRTYVFAHAPFYSTVSLSYLAETFDLPVPTVTSLVSQMIWNDQLAASLDQTSGLVVLTRAERSPLQQMAIALADRAATLLQDNERHAQAKLGDADQKTDGGRERGEGGGGMRRGHERRARGVCTLCCSRGRCLSC
jgi:translation initiation factor 3 subunit C